jgi:hypothetical protein
MTQAPLSLDTYRLLRRSGLRVSPRTMILPCSAGHVAQF